MKFVERVPGGAANLHVMPTFVPTAPGTTGVTAQPQNNGSPVPPLDRRSPCAARPAVLLPDARRRGVALIMVLCALFLLTLIVFGLARRVNDELIFVGRDNRSLEAKALAFTGLQIALHPAFPARGPTPCTGKWTPGTATPRASWARADDSTSTGSSPARTSASLAS